MTDRPTVEAAMLEAALHAAELGREVLVPAFLGDAELNVQRKSEFDFVTEIDRASEQAIVGYLREHFPDHGVLAEEGGDSEGSGEYRWIVDPLDGTTNFIQGVPWFSISIAALQGDEPVVGVVSDPMRGDVYATRRGCGATLNGKTITVSAAERLEDCLLATGFPFRNKDNLPVFWQSFERLFRRSAGARRMGSAALDLAGVALGRFGGFWELGLSRWDIAAGVLLVREAGGTISGFGADPDFWETGNLLATNGRLHETMRAELDAVFGGQ